MGFYANGVGGDVGQRNQAMMGGGIGLEMFKVDKNFSDTPKLSKPLVPSF